MRQGPNPRRSRGRGPRKPHLATKQQTFDSNGPDVRVRGNAYQVLEKYLALARDANSAGDRIAAENYQQHAEHYFRIISANGDANGQNGRARNAVRPDGYVNGADGAEGGDGESDNGPASPDASSDAESDDAEESEEPAGIA